MLALRSIVFNVVFYIHMIGVFVVVTPVYFFLPQRLCVAVVTAWGRRSLWLLKVICGTRTEFRGLANLPPGPVLLAGKHQSLFETFALLTILKNPAVIIKKELLHVPIWGWWAYKAGMIYVSRKGGAAALKEIVAGGKRVIGQGRPIIIFPEGTRRMPGAPPDYKVGIVHLYGRLGLPVVPVALNSGFYWPRRASRRYPGTIVVDVLPPIEPGLPPRAFLTRLTEVIETASDRLILEADAATPRPPFAPEAEARLAALREAASPRSGH